MSTTKPIRVSEKLHGKLKERAVKKNTSLTKLCETVLSESLKPTPKNDKPL